MSLRPRRAARAAVPTRVTACLMLSMMKALRTSMTRSDSSPAGRGSRGGGDVPGPAPGAAGPGERQHVAAIIDDLVDEIRLYLIAAIGEHRVGARELPH